MSKHERRFHAAKEIELRAYAPAEDGAQRDIGGYAAVFNSPTMIGSYFREQVAPGAFTDAIKNCDVRALFNHDANYVIGRNVSKTLVMTEDDRGLTWRASPPDTTWARDLAVSIDRGDISGCSFSFVPTVEEWDYAGDVPLRTIIACELYDVSAVTYPAYDDTSVSLRDGQSPEARAKEVFDAAIATRDAGLVVSPSTLARVAAKRRLLDRFDQTIRA